MTITRPAQVGQYHWRVEQALERFLPSTEKPPARLHEAMRYAVLSGGKRIRPVLVYAAGAAVGVAPEQLDAPAAAVELIHAYSLIHDDLPAMDDDDLRRGRPTCHKAFDEATAILAGDALQALAFQVLAADDSGPLAAQLRRLRRLRLLGEACGSFGMAGGQALDMDAVGGQLTLAELEAMHRLKTGALIRCSVLLGALGAVVDEALLGRLGRYAECIGLAFQIQDDILDVTAETSTLGKTQGADVARGKPTYPALLGLEPARQRALALCEEAGAQLAPFDTEQAAVLHWLARFIIERQY